MFGYRTNFATVFYKIYFGYRTKLSVNNWYNIVYIDPNLQKKFDTICFGYRTNFAIEIW